MGWIITLIVLGILLFIAELVLLPGLTIAAIGSFCCLVVAVAWAFTSEGLAIGFIVLVIVLVILTILTLIFLRSKTWHRVSLTAKLEEAVDESIDTRVSIGDRGVAMTRLAPMGKVLVEGKIFEAKSMGDYIDQQSRIEIIGFENSNVVVKLIH